MMAGTSQHAFENIGKGAMVGADDWQVANRELIKAQKERQKELAYVEQARRAEARDDWKSAQQYRAQAAEREAAHNRFGTTAVLAAQGKDLDLGTEDAKIASQQWSTMAQVGASVYHADRAADASIYGSKLGYAGTMGAAKYAADSRLQSAELRYELLKNAAEGKGGFTAEQLSKVIDETKTSPEFVQYSKELAKIKGSNAVNTPEFQTALNTKLNELVQQRVAQVAQIRSGVPSSSLSNPSLDKLLSDPTLSKYFAK